MSKIRLILAVALVALAICLSACGENKDTGATSDTAHAERGTEPLSSQTSGSAYAAEKPNSDRGSESASSSGNEADEPISGGDTTEDKKHDAQPDGENLSPQNGAEPGKQKSQGNGSSDQKNQGTSSRSSEGENGSPNAVSSADDKQVDNAEVNFNDL